MRQLVDQCEITYPDAHKAVGLEAFKLLRPLLDLLPLVEGFSGNLIGSPNKAKHVREIRIGCIAITMDNESYE